MFFYSVSPLEKMISSEVLDGVPLLVLANKQDVPVHRSDFPLLYIYTDITVKSQVEPDDDHAVFVGLISACVSNCFDTEKHFLTIAKPELCDFHSCGSNYPSNLPVFSLLSELFVCA